MGLFTSKKTATGPPAGPATVDPLDPDGGLPVFESHSGGLWVNGTRLKLKGEIGARMPNLANPLSLFAACLGGTRSYQSAPPALLPERAPSAPTRARPHSHGPLAHSRGPPSHPFLSVPSLSDFPRRQLVWPRDGRPRPARPLVPPAPRDHGLRGGPRLQRPAPALLRPAGGRAGHGQTHQPRRRQPGPPGPDGGRPAGRHRGRRGRPGHPHPAGLPPHGGGALRHPGAVVRAGGVAGGARHQGLADDRPALRPRLERVWGGPEQ